MRIRASRPSLADFGPQSWSVDPGPSCSMRAKLVEVGRCRANFDREFGPTLLEIGGVWAKLGRLRASCDRCHAKVAQVCWWSIPGNFGPHLVEVGPSLAFSGLESVKFGLTSAELGPNLFDAGSTSPLLVGFVPNLGTVAGVRPNAAGVGPIWANFDPDWANFGYCRPELANVAKQIGMLPETLCGRRSGTPSATTMRLQVPVGHRGYGHRTTLAQGSGSPLAIPCVHPLGGVGQRYGSPISLPGGLRYAHPPTRFQSNSTFKGGRPNWSEIAQSRPIFNKYVLAWRGLRVGLELSPFALCVAVARQKH